jgi:hypothetical protein
MHAIVGEAPSEKAQMAQEFFGGRIRFERDSEYVETEDGRKLSFSLLSSGQQELLPLWLALEDVARVPFSDLVFIEEPEAHLFPSAQVKLASYLASLTSATSSRRRLLITTHSPYVLSHVNNLMKAGSLGVKGGSLGAKVAKIIPRKCWLRHDSVRAYALANKRAVPIISEGLIDGEYLDQISGDVSSMFLQLLELEVEYGSS